MAGCYAIANQSWPFKYLIITEETDEYADETDYKINRYIE